MDLLYLPHTILLFIPCFVCFFFVDHVFTALILLLHCACLLLLHPLVFLHLSPFFSPLAAYESICFNYLSIFVCHGVHVFFYFVASFWTLYLIAHNHLPLSLWTSPCPLWATYSLYSNKPVLPCYIISHQPPLLNSAFWYCWFLPLEPSELPLLFRYHSCRILHFLTISQELLCLLFSLDNSTHICNCGAVSTTSTQLQSEVVLVSVITFLPQGFLPQIFFLLSHFHEVCIIFHFLRQYYFILFHSSSTAIPA